MALILREYCSHKQGKTSISTLWWNHVWTHNKGCLDATCMIKVFLKTLILREYCSHKQGKTSISKLWWNHVWTHNKGCLDATCMIHIRDKWVCGTRLISHRRSQIPFRYAISLNADWAGPTGKRTIWQFERSPQTCLGPQAVLVCPLNLLYSHSARRRMERNWGVISEMQVSVLQTR